MSNKAEIRTLADKFKPTIREVEGQPESREVEGYAIVFGQKSRVLFDDREYYEFFREVIQPGAVTAEDFRGYDVKMTMYHNREKLLARSFLGEGTLDITVDDTGVKYHFVCPDTPTGNECLGLVRRGDLCGASFAFIARDENITWAKDDDGIPLRYVNKISDIQDMTIAADPAYTKTTARTREAYEKLNPEKVEEARKAERMQKAVDAAKARRREISALTAAGKVDFI